VSGKGNKIIPRWWQISEKKERLITTMEAEIQAFDIFPILLISHYPLPLKVTSRHIRSAAGFRRVELPST
jgi:hypothetical protein